MLKAPSPPTRNPKTLKPYEPKVEQLDKQLEEQKSLHTILSAQIKRQD